MKKMFILVIMLSLFIGCDSDDDVTIVEEEPVSLLGTWLYIAGRNNDDAPPLPEDELPFIELESENTITFYPDSIITSNSRSLCANNHSSGNPTTGIYTLIDSTYISNDCANPNYKYSFTQTDSIVIISYPYNGISEGKFKKIADLED